MPDMQNRYGTSSGLFSWGELANRRYNPSDFFETGSNVINSVALSTGNTKNQTYLSASTTNSGGILPNNSYNRYNFTARNTTHFLNDKLTLDIGAQYIVQNNKNMVSQGQYYNPLPSLYLFPRGDNLTKFVCMNVIILTTAIWNNIGLMVMQVCHYKIHIGYKIASTVLPTRNVI